MKRIATLYLGLCLAVQATPASAPPTAQYRLEMDVYVVDDLALCEQAWKLEAADHGDRMAEAMLMRDSEFDTAKCVNIVYQKFHPPGVVGAGIEVKQQ